MHVMGMILELRLLDPFGGAAQPRLFPRVVWRTAGAAE